MWLYSTNLVHNITSTRLTSQSQTLIDNLFSSIINDDCIACNLISLLSDHHAQFLPIPNYTITQNSKKDLCKQHFKHFSSKKFITNLEKVNWDNILNVSEGNVDNYFQNFSDKNMCLLLSLVWIKWKVVISHGLQKEFWNHPIQKMIFTENLLEPKISIPKNFTTQNLKDTKAW